MPMAKASQKLDRFFRPNVIAPQSPWDTISIRSSGDGLSHDERAGPPRAVACFQTPCLYFPMLASWPRPRES